jgi:hypothetical protein
MEEDNLKKDLIEEDLKKKKLMDKGRLLHLKGLIMRKKNNFIEALLYFSEAYKLDE